MESIKIAIFFIFLELGSFNKMSATVFDSKKYHGAIRSFLCDENMRFAHQDSYDPVRVFLRKMHFNLKQSSVNMRHMKDDSLKLYCVLEYISMELRERREQLQMLSVEEQVMLTNCKKINKLSWIL